MAIYHCSAKVSKHASAKHDYICRENKYENQSDKCRESFSENLPAFANNDSSDFWKACDSNERANANKLREYEVALPLELTSIEQKKLVQDFVQHLTTAYSKEPLPCTVAIHEGKGTNPHAHIVLCERATSDTLNAKDFFSRKNPKSKELGGSDRVATLEQIREKWSTLLNQQLDRKSKVSHKSLKSQGIEREPTKHIGPAEREQYSPKQQARAKENKAIKTGNAVAEASLFEHKQALKLEMRYRPKKPKKPSLKERAKPTKNDFVKQFKQAVNNIEQNAFDDVKWEQKLLNDMNKPGFWSNVALLFGLETESMRAYKQQLEAVEQAKLIHSEAKNMQGAAKKELWSRCVKAVKDENREASTDVKRDVLKYNKAIAMNKAFDAKIRSLEEKIDLVLDYKKEKEKEQGQKQEYTHSKNSVNEMTMR